MAVSSHSHEEDDAGRRPPHGLQLVIDFVNTRDIDLDSEALASPQALSTWLADHGLAAPPADRRALTASVDVREALRAVLLSHNGGPDAPEALATLERTAERGRLSVVFHGDGSVGTEPRAAGIDGALAALLVPVAQAAADGTWQRVKACPADDCQWAFYDHSRNRSGRWCDMAVCGNRTKVRAYRSKRSD
jgi:predicted RNA-binding Zn ribbon-like protein